MKFGRCKNCDKMTHVRRRYGESAPFFWCPCHHPPNDDQIFIHSRPISDELQGAIDRLAAIPDPLTEAPLPNPSVFMPPMETTEDTPRVTGNILRDQIFDGLFN